MTDKVIRVNVTASKSQKVTVSSSKVANEITASPDTSAYYSRLAKNWAIAEGLVENIDYSSKHYAQESKASADMAKTYEISTQENYNMFMESSFNANSELQTNRDGALADIEGAKTSAIDSLNSIKDENISTIESKANEEIENFENLSEQEQNKIINLGIDTRANVDLSNLTQEGEKHFLNKSQITNCITEIPQRIKLELADGTLTLKAGSEVIVPNGFEADGTTPKFDYVTIESDLAISTWGSDITNTCVLGFRKDEQTSKFVTLLPNCIFSGSTKPTPNVGDYWLWYDTVSNKIKYTSDNGTTWTSEYCAFSIARTQVTNSVFTSIDQTFNGIGYIGSTVWVDKGVKGLAPNGRNEDGSLKNIEYTFDRLLTVTQASTDRNCPIFYETLNNGQLLLSDTIKYDSELNEFTQNGRLVTYKKFELGQVNISSNIVTNFQPKLPFRAIDYSDKTEISGWGMPSNKSIDLTLGASGSTYTAPANGWVHLRKQSNATNQFIQIWVLEGVGPQIYSSSSTQDLSVYVPVIKGRTFGVNYTANGETRAFKFIYAQGEV